MATTNTRRRIPPGAARAAIGRAGAPFGLGVPNLQILESMRRPEWLYRARLPRGEMKFREARPVSEEDVVLCERLIASYVAATSTEIAGERRGGMWAEIFDTRQRSLGQALDQRNPAALAELLASMFRSDFVLGIALGSLYSHSRSRLGSRIWRLKSLDGLLSLAEALGAVPTESPEQGTLGQAFGAGIGAVRAKIEGTLAISIDFPDVGAAYGLDAAGTLVPLESPELIYAAVRLRQAVRRYLEQERIDRLRLVEIGAGYGGMAYWFLRLHPNVERYRIVDLPVTNVLHGYFLSQALGADEVSLFGEEPARVQVLPDSALDTIEDVHDVFVNKDSFPEMPEQAMLRYLEWARAKCDGIIYSYNQEAGAVFQGVRQNVVPAAMERLTSFAKVHRECSWLRRGYVEEVYAHQPVLSLDPRDSAAAELSGPG